MIKPQESWAVVAISRSGRDQVRRLLGLRPMTVWLPERLASSNLPAEVLHYYDRPLSHWMGEVFHDYPHWIWVMPVSLATRLVAPFIRDKHTDPSVTVVDDSGRYAVCLLSCHLGGGNDITRDVAQILQAVPVLTTASETLGIPILEFIGREWNWQVENPGAIARIGRMLSEGEAIGVVQESGPPAWRYREAFSRVYDKWDNVPPKKLQDIRGWLWITHHRISFPESIQDAPVLIYRPKVLSLGIGFSRNATYADLQELVFKVLEENLLSPHSVERIVTIDVKEGDEELERLAAHNAWRVQYVSPGDLNRVELNQSPFNPKVFETTGAYRVAEPAAILGAQGGPLLVHKCKSDRVTVAVALKIPLRNEKSVKTTGLA